MPFTTDAVTLFLSSALIGLSIAAPVGPIGLLTIQRSLQLGPRAGLATGLGAALADAAYGAVGAYGITGLIAGLERLRPLLVTVGGIVLLWLAWGIWRAPVDGRAADLPLPDDRASQVRLLLRCCAGTLLLTLSNPSTILSFLAVFGALAGRHAQASPALMVAGVFFGSAAWWLLLSQVVGRLRERFDAVWRRRVNRASALLLAGLASWPWLMNGWQAIASG
jgi:threonine/homoserine/homoserine lactone efflux protein